LNILITGSSGFFGNLLIKELSNKNVIFKLSRSQGEYKNHLEKEIPFFNHKFDLVIHAAGKAHFIPRTNLEKKQFYNVNVIGTRNLLHGLEKNRIPSKFVFISTVAVYGLSSGKMIPESSNLNAVDPYGESKLIAENLINEWCKKNNVICTILRLPLLVGLDAPGNFGSMLNGIKKGYYVNIANGKAKKSMVLADDVAKCILKVSEIGGVFNLTDGYHPSFKELSIEIATQLGKSEPLNIPISIAKVMAKIGDYFRVNAPFNSDKLHKIITDLTYDDTKARVTFGWDPTPVLKGFSIKKSN
jgi:nucleoside-diphosphate-sugar epimerase